MRCTARASEHQCSCAGRACKKHNTGRANPRRAPVAMKQRQQKTTSAPCALSRVHISCEHACRPSSLSVFARTRSIRGATSSTSSADAWREHKAGNRNPREARRVRDSKEHQKTTSALHLSRSSMTRSCKQLRQRGAPTTEAGCQRMQKATANHQCSHAGTDPKDCTKQPVQQSETGRANKLHAG